LLSFDFELEVSRENENGEDRKESKSSKCFLFIYSDKKRRSLHSSDIIEEKLPNQFSGMNVARINFIAIYHIYNSFLYQVTNFHLCQTINIQKTNQINSKIHQISLNNSKASSPSFRSPALSHSSPPLLRKARK
jgi:hypothetical protein